jgi:endonuclease/exonuclease/phosphatase family metal-dependent hydrolase
MIRVASYNIRKAIGTDRRRNPARILDVLGEIDADIVALQEADRRFGARKSAIPLDMLSAHSPYHAVPFETRPDSIGWHGNAILVRDPSHIIRYANIPIPTLEPRGAVFADIKTQIGKIRIIGMHLDLSGLRRRQQIRTILRHPAFADDPIPTILMGDFNEWSPHGGSMTEFHDHQIAATPPSFHSRRPVARLDRIIACDRTQLHDVGTHHSLKARVASDHLPIWADISLA